MSIQLKPTALPKMTKKKIKELRKTFDAHFPNRREWGKNLLAFVPMARYERPDNVLLWGAWEVARGVPYDRGQFMETFDPVVINEMLKKLEDNELD